MTDYGNTIDDKKSVIPVRYSHISTKTDIVSILYRRSNYVSSEKDTIMSLLDAAKATQEPCDISSYENQQKNTTLHLLENHINTFMC